MTPATLTLLVLACGLAAATDTQRVRYDGYMVYRLVPANTNQVEILRGLMVTDVDLDFWDEPSHPGLEVAVMVPPHRQRDFLGTLGDMKLTFNTQDVQQNLDQFWEELDQSKAVHSLAFDYDNFNRYDEIISELDVLVADCPSKFSCEKYSIGKSAEDRDITVLKVSEPGVEKRALWLDSAIHAREWLAPATLMKILNHVVRNYGSDETATSMLDTYDFYFLPVVNPDGYEYSFLSRYWRKNRRQIDSSSSCKGADLNRNYDFRWANDGVSFNPCSDLYCGSSGGSEPETQAVQDEVRRVGATLDAFVTIHAYGQMWMHPWGNTRDGWSCDLADDHSDMMKVSSATADAIQNTYGTYWSRGNSCEVIYATSGGSDDYAKGAGGVKYSFCPELRGRDFVVSKNQIDPSFTEVWNGVVAMVAKITELEG